MAFTPSEAFIGVKLPIGTSVSALRGKYRICVNMGYFTLWKKTNIVEGAKQPNCNSYLNDMLFSHYRIFGNKYIRNRQVCNSANCLVSKKSQLWFYLQKNKLFE